MATAKKDDNRKNTIIAVSKVDQETPVRVKVNPVNNAVLVELG